MVTTSQKYVIDKHTKKKKESRHNSKDSHQITTEQREERGKKDLQKQIQNN